MSNRTLSGVRLDPDQRRAQRAVDVQLGLDIAVEGARPIAVGLRRQAEPLQRQRPEDRVQVRGCGGQRRWIRQRMWSCAQAGLRRQ